MKIPQENNLKRDHRIKRFNFTISKSKINDFYGHLTTNPEMGIDDFLAEKPKYKSRKKLFLKAGWIRRKITKIYR